MTVQYPTISILFFVFNESTNLSRLLPSLTAQSYPKKKIEYIAVDDESTDNSPQLLREFGAKVITIDRSKITHPVYYRTEYNKGLGLHMAKGDLVYWMDADMEICDKDFLKKLVAPLVQNPTITGSLTREYAIDGLPKESSSFLRYLSYDNTQRDPVLKFFSTDIEETIVDDKETYFLCRFEPHKVPPSGRIMYRRKLLLSTSIKNDVAFYDLDSLQIMVEEGHQFYAFVPDAKIRHYHASNFVHFIKKRLRNLEGNFFSTLERKRFVWFRTDNSQDLLKIVYWIIYANLFVPELIKSIYLSVRHRDSAYLWEPITALVLTDLLVIKSMTNPTGIRMIRKMLSI